MLFDAVSLADKFPFKSRRGIAELIGFFNADQMAWPDLRKIAYSMATVQHETGASYRPIEEWGKGRGYKYGKLFRGYSWYGRGYCQLTWYENYRRFDDELGYEGALTNNPALALVPEHAYRILAHGMLKGRFTGVALKRFIDGDECDYIGARRVVNGMDQARKVAGYALKWENLLMEFRLDIETFESAYGHL